MSAKKILSMIASFIIATGICGGCGGEEQYGDFCDLEYAYSSGLLTEENIGAIAEKHNNKRYDTLTSEVALELKKAYAFRHERKDLTHEDVVIDEYLGKYGNCFAVIIRYNDTYAVAEYSSVTVADFQLNYDNGLRIAIYK